MPKQGMEGFGELLGDLWRELTPVVRACLFGGMALGFALSVYLILRIPAEEPHSYMVARAELRVILFMVFGLTFLGAFAGTAVGVSLELLFGKKDGTDKKKSNRRGGKSSRR
jgi:hypothetical protein